MKNNRKKRFLLAGFLWLAFVLFTVCVLRVDVKPIGPGHSTVGFAAVNQWMFQHLGIHPFWYTVTQWLGVAAILTAGGFGMLGLLQLVRRKSLRRVDRRLLAMGCFYVLLLAVYLFFEQVVINYRPVMLENGLEASYPSSHTALVLCIMGTAAIEIHARVPGRKRLSGAVTAAAVSVSAVTVAGRLLSGVHWFTDVVGGVLVSAALIALYWAVLEHIHR